MMAVKVNLFKMNGNNHFLSKYDNSEFGEFVLSTYAEFDSHVFVSYT